MFLPSFLEEERGKKDGRGKNVNKENMGEGQKRENGVFTRKLWPVFVALCQLWIIVSKMIVAYMRDCKCYRQWLPLWICFKLSLKDDHCTRHRLTNWVSDVLIFGHFPCWQNLLSTIILNPDTQNLKNSITQISTVTSQKNVISCRIHKSCNNLVWSEQTPNLSQNFQMRIV